MKRLFLVLLFTVMGVCLFAQAADFSSLPSGSWLDHNYNGTWTFSATGITLKCNMTGSSSTFTTGNIQGLRSVMNGRSAGIQFSSSATGKTYTFIPIIADGTMRLTIDREGEPQYVVVMQKR